MVSPAADDGPVTVVNVFDIAEDEIDTFVSKWEQRSRLITSAEGFVSAQLYRAIDSDTRFKVVNVTEWASLAHFHAAVDTPGYRAELESYKQSSTWTAHRGFYRTAAKFG